MLFGQSIFQSVLERLKEEAPDEDDEIPTHRIPGLSSGFAFDVMEGVSAASQRADQAYFDNLEPEHKTFRPKEPQQQEKEPPIVPAAAPVPETMIAPEPPEPVMPDHLKRITPREIAAELAISAADTPQSLSEKRRAFAKANHPDGVPAAFRDHANRRMKLANLFIDEALKQLGR